MKTSQTIPSCLLHIYWVFGKQDIQGAYPLEEYITPGERDHKQVNKSADGAKCY